MFRSKIIKLLKYRIAGLKKGEKESRMYLNQSEGDVLECIKWRDQIYKQKGAIWENTWLLEILESPALLDKYLSSKHDG